MEGIARWFMLAAVVSALGGMVWGIQMSASQDHLLSPAHGHLNLLGWVSCAIYAFYYHLLPAAAGGVLPRLHLAAALLALGLLLCALGDYCLFRDGEGAFMAGVGAFAAGHLAYAVLFLTREASDPARLLQMPGIAIAAALLVLGLVMARILAPRAGALKGPVLAYIPIILSMGAAAATLPGQGALVWALPAALAFVASDVVLAFETFVLPEGHRFRRIAPYAVWPLYWGAQLGFWYAFS